MKPLLTLTLRTMSTATVLSTGLIAAAALSAAPPAEKLPQAPAKPRETGASRPEASRPEASRPGASRPEASKPQASKPQPAKPQSTTPTPSRPTPADRVVSKPVAPPVKPAGEPTIKPAQPPKPEPARPVEREPASRKPVAPERDDRPITRPVTPARPDARKPIEVKPREEKPREERPTVQRPVAPERDDRPIGTKPRDERPSDSVSPRRPGTAIIEPTKPREVRDETPASRSERPLPKRPSNPTLVERGRPIEDRADDLRGQFSRDTVHGVPIARPEPRGEPARGGRPRDRHEERERHDRYVRGIARCNGWWPGSHWSDCGPCHVWQPYHCRDGLSISVGFGSGFSFGFFYGTSCAPLCSSWCNPWWDGYATWWSCRPSWCWSDAWCRPYGRPWIHPAHHGCGPGWSTCWSAWTPCYAYSPVVYQPVVYSTPVVVRDPVPNPDAMWAFLADGYDRDAEDGFILLEVAEPHDERWVIGQAVARAFRGETARAASLLRGALSRDPAAIARLSGDPKFIARLEALERSLDPLVQAPRPSADALLVAASSKAARGALSDAYLDATTAASEGDQSAGTAALVSWLRAELRRAP